MNRDLTLAQKKELLSRILTQAICEGGHQDLLDHADWLLPNWSQIRKLAPSWFWRPLENEAVPDTRVQPASEWQGQASVAPLFKMK